MSSYFPRSKDLTRTRKSVADSPPTSPASTDKNYRHERLSRYDSSGETATDKPLGRTSSYTRREARLAALNRQEDSITKDYKKMYEDALHENENLKTRLHDSKQELAKLRSQLEKVTQKQHDRISERSSALESEKREKQTLEKRVSDMEEEIKAYPALAQAQSLRRVNQCLLAENRAMLRALARLSETAAMPETEDL